MTNSLKTYIICHFILLFTFLFSISYNYEIREYTYLDFIKEETIYEENVDGSMTYKISYEKGQISQRYMRITAMIENEEYAYLYYSPISEKREDAVLLYSGKEEVSLYIDYAFTKKEADGNIYFSVACFSSTCSYEISILELDEIDLDREGQYTYYTTDKKNTQNIFKIFRADYKEEEGYLTFWAVGSKDIQMKVKYVDESAAKETIINTSELVNGKYAFIKESDFPVDSEINSSMYFFIIEIISTANSLITVGSNLNLIDNNQKVTYYSPNSKEIYGVLNNISPKQCFDFGIEKTRQIIYHLHILDFQNSLYINETDNNFKNIKTYDIKDGKILIILGNENAGHYFCLENKNQYISSFSLQVTYDIENNYYKNIYSPQVNGYFYERYLEPGQFAFYTGLSSIKYKTELRYYLKINSGFPELYFAKCNTFPYCEFDFNNLSSDIIKPNKINDMYSYSIYKTEIKNLISPEQYVLLVFCNLEKNCSFETNFYTELDEIVLPKEKKVYQTIMNEGMTNFTINLKGETNNYKQVFVDFLTYSGDISINYYVQGFTVKDFISGNKKYFVLNKLDGHENYTISFSVTGEMASYYSVNYKLIYEESDKKIMIEESGINYLETIEPKYGNKMITLINSRPNYKRNFLVNFFPLNCEIAVTRKINEKEKKLENIDYLAQDIILYDEEEYKAEKYDYYMEIIKMNNVTQYESNSCMVYVSSIEQNLNDDTDYNYKKRQLLVSEGVINQAILNKDYPKIDYIYPHTNPSGYVVINLNMETNSKINIKINIENKTYKEIETSNSQYIIIEESVLRSDEYCPFVKTRPDQVCSIIIEMTLDSNFYDDEPVIEFIIKSKEIIPTFIKKTMMRKDVIVGNSYQYYFTEIGKNEEGNITINFDRGSGNVYGRIVQKNANEGSGWMKRYIMPNEKNNQLKYDYYTKKSYYNMENSQNCDYGCYLFLKVEPSSFLDEYYLSENIGYPITISINSYDASLPDITPDLLNSVDIPINEYIIGDTIPISGRFNDFYTFWIPYDCEEIVFEFLGDSTYIFINIGNTKPSIDKADFSINELGKDDILRITKEQILNKTNESSIKNIQLTMGVGAKYIDNIESSLYSFRIRALKKDEKENGIELIELNSDQKTLCDIEKKIDNCYFILPHLRKIDEQNNFYFHALDLPNVQYNYYAYEINKDYIINRNYEEIKIIIDDKQNAKWSSKNSKSNYLYIDNSEIDDKENGVYFILNLEINKADNEKTIISLLHTTYSYKGIIMPNPSSSQLFIVNNNNLNELYLNFAPHNKNLIINIKLISGEGRVFWDLSDDIICNKNKDINSEYENVKYYINNPGDSIKLTIGNSDIFPLHFINIETSERKDSNDRPGFGFYIYFERESQVQNYHNLPYASSSLFSIKDSDLPFIFYTKLPDKLHEVELIFKLKSLDQKSKNEISLNDKFAINGIVIDEDFIYNKKSKSELIPNQTNILDGTYEPTEKIFRIQFTPEIIKTYDIKGNNYLYVNVLKKNENEQKYTDITLDYFVSPSNHDGYYSKINEYIYGKIPYEQDGYSRYELTRINTLYKYMRIEFSSNYDKIDFALNYHKSIESAINYYKNNTNFVKSEFYNGKTEIIIELKDDNIISVYLSVFNTENSHVNKEKKLSNFVFKYEVNEKNEFNKIKPEKNEVSDIKYERSTLTFTLPKILGISLQSQVNYIAKIIPVNDLVENEKLNSIALMESKTVKMYTKSSNGLEKMELIDFHNDNIYYVIINCEVIEPNNEEKFGFNYLYNPTNYKGDNEKTNYSLAIVIIVFAVVVLVIGFAIAFIFLRNTNLKRSSKLEELNNSLNSSSVFYDKS